MQSTSVTRVQVWSRWLMISHWMIAFSTLGLLATGFLVSHQLYSNSMVHEIHYIFTGILLPALLVRAYLLFFGQGTDHITDCEPDAHRLSQAWQVMKFYLTLGKAPLPKWYSHNPLWGPLYLIFFFFLTLSTVSGFLLLNEILVIYTISVGHLHLFAYQVIAVFTALHLMAVFAHDMGGTGSDISGMVNGHRIFEMKQESDETGDIQTVELDDLLKTLKK